MSGHPYAPYGQAFMPMMPQNQRQHPIYGNVARHDIGIMPTESVAPNDTVPATLIIDSRKRNTVNYPDAGHYVFQLNRPYKDVVSLELVSTSLPNSGYTITENNNKLYYALDGAAQAHTNTITIPVGNYAFDGLNQPTTLLAALNAQLDGFSYNVSTQRILFDPDGTTTRFFVGLTGNADDVIGLDGSDDFSTPPLDPEEEQIPIRGNEFTGTGGTPMPRNFMLQPHRYVTMKIRGFDRCEGNTTALDGAFAVIPLDTTEGSYTLIKEGDTVDSDTYVYYFPEPKPLTRLEITFYDPYGNVYNFNGHDHYMIFQIQSLTRPVKYKGCK